jgi:phytoene dehydrogenase-like protein
VIRDRELDAIVVGSGPNGLAAAITLAREGLSVRVYEAAPTIGGGIRSAELTLPGHVHDPCTTVVATTASSPFMVTLDLVRHGVELVHPDAPAGHVLPDGRSALLERSVAATAEGLGVDGTAYRRLMAPLVDDADRILPWVLGLPIRPPRHPIAVARFGLRAIASSTILGRLFREERAPALLGALSAHAMTPLRQPATASFGLVLAVTGHAVGWPVVRGGSQRLADALVAELTELGGEVVPDHEVTSLDELPPARATLLDVTPRQLVRIAGDDLPAGYRRALERFRYGPGVCKVDYALDGPIPWADAALERAGTVHLGGTLADIERSEAEVARGRMPERPFVILVQASRFDGTRAPDGAQTAWAYAHVPHGYPGDASEALEAQVERAAPGFRDRIRARVVHTAPQLEAYDANYIGGDIGGGAQDLRQLFTRPVIRWDPYATPVRGLYLCSSSTPPGGGAHGMCGHLAARSALRREFGIHAHPTGSPGATRVSSAPVPPFVS